MLDPNHALATSSSSGVSSSTTSTCRGAGYGHVLEYSAEHLAWQFERAGFGDYESSCGTFTTCRMSGWTVLSALRAPLRRIPRFRDNLLAVATAP